MLVIVDTTLVLYFPHYYCTQAEPMEGFMSKENTPASGKAEDLVKTSKGASVELSESEIALVTGGKKGQKQEEYLKIKLEDVLISSY